MRRLATRSDYGDILLAVARNYPLKKTAEELMEAYKITSYELSNVVRRLKQKGINIDKRVSSNKVMRSVIAELRDTDPQLFTGRRVI